MNRPKASPVPSRHVLVKSLDCGGAGQLSVLLVHVVGAASRVVSDPDTKVLDLKGVLLVNLTNVSFYQVVGHVSTYRVDGDNLTRGLLDLLQTSQEVPVSRLGDNLVRGKDTHAVQSRRRVRLGRQMPADDLVFL